LTHPHVSVLLPVRNGAAFLGAALRSVARQTSPPLQLVAVDDASTDATPAVLAAWQGRLPLTVVPGAGTGLVDALNVGLAACTGDLVARMDADDVMLPRRLEAQVRHLEENPHLAVCGTEVRSFPRRAVSPKRVAYDGWLSSLHTPEEHARDIYVEAPLAHPTAMVPKDWLTRVGGYQERGWPEDYDLWLRLHGAGARLGKPAGVLHLWREHPDRISRRHGAYTRDAIRACRIHHLATQHRLRERGVVVMGAGLEGKAAGRALLREGVAVVAHVDADLRKVGGRLMGEGGVRVLGPEALPGLRRDHPGALVVVAIGTAGARPGLRTQLATLGLREPEDAVFVA
jgi:hypothetical protein